MGHFMPFLSFLIFVFELSVVFLERWKICGDSSMIQMDAGTYAVSTLHSLLLADPDVLIIMDKKSFHLHLSPHYCLFLSTHALISKYLSFFWYIEATTKVCRGERSTTYRVSQQVLDEKFKWKSQIYAKLEFWNFLSKKNHQIEVRSALLC